MCRLKIVDRIALSSMLLTALAIPIAANALSLPASPGAQVRLANGNERQFFTSGPLGTTTYRVDLDPSGRVVARAQVLTDSVFGQVRPGMKAAEVLELIGPPGAKTRFGSLHETAWDYHYRDGWGYISDFSVMVDDSGVVAGKFATREGDTAGELRHRFQQHDLRRHHVVRRPQELSVDGFVRVRDRAAR